jgi:hypothetical protein
VFNALTSAEPMVMLMYSDTGLFMRKSSQIICIVSLNSAREFFQAVFVKVHQRMVKINNNALLDLVEWIGRHC